MGAESAFEQAVRKIIEKSTPITITEGTVKSVDKAARTCDVERDDLPELFDVRLTATLEPGDDVATIFPTPGEWSFFLRQNVRRISKRYKYTSSTNDISISSW